ncbi:hypothetical protein [Bacillus sp. JCM 19034]|uniref:hypothetical protein n=1 Tax=Bacillus sp. JCM 19034 TaxID=1481928 RepID=UPI000782DCA3|nr:hypothetical protein [Bacillus sp. JCM 19034]
MSYNRMRLERIRSNYVNRLTSSTTVQAVEKIEATRPVENETKHPTDNFILSYERYYRALQELKEEFKQFYHREQELKNAIEQLDENGTLIYQTEQLIQKYNKAISALMQYDRITGSAHTDVIITILQHYEEAFSKVGISINHHAYLSFQCNKLLHFLTTTSNTHVTELIRDFKSLIIKEYYSFIKVKNRQSKMENTYEPPPLITKGLMIEEQC